MIIRIVYVKFIILSVFIKLNHKVAVRIRYLRIVANVGMNNIRIVANVVVNNIKIVVNVVLGNIKIVANVGMNNIKIVANVVISSIRIVANVLVVINKKVNAFVKRVLNSIMLITLDKIFGLLLAAIVLASLKYAISGCLSVNWEDFNLNFSLAFFGGIFRFVVKELSFEYLNLKGINYNIDQLLFGLNKHRMGSDHDLGEFKPKLYNCMDIDDEPSFGKSLDKGKGVSEDSDRMSISGESDNDKPLDKGKGVSQDNNSSGEESNGHKTKRLDKGKGVDRNIHPDHPSAINEEVRSPIVWNIKPMDPIDPNMYMPNFPPKTNPGPGFNVPGGVVPLRDEICKYIDYNSHILRQFRTMDLETAIEQRDNNLKMIEVLKKKLEFGQIKLAREGVGEVPKNDYEVWLKQKVAIEAQWLHETMAKGNGRQTLLLSRIEYILIEEEKKNNK